MVKNYVFRGLLSVFTLAAQTGCGAMLNYVASSSAQNPDTGMPMAPPSAKSSPVCEKLAADDKLTSPQVGPVRPSLSDNFTLAEYVTALSCSDESGGNLGGRDEFTQTHATFEDRRFDHLAAAAMTVDCAMNKNCGPIRTGLLATYLPRLDDQRAIAAASRIDAAVGERFAEMLSTARTVMVKKISELDPRRRAMYVDAPNKVRKQREEYYKKNADWYAKLDVILEAGGDPAQAAEKLSGLRNDFLRKCGGEDCLVSLFHVELTRVLMKQYLLAKDFNRLAAEVSLFETDEVLAASYFSQLLTEQVQATQAEAKAWEKYSRAKSDGTDQSTLVAMFGDPPPVQVSPDAPSIELGYPKSVSYRAVTSGLGLGNQAGIVRQVSLKGDVGEVSFEDYVTQYDDQDCVETNVVDRITSNGELVYRKKCRKTGTITHRTKIAPITVPRGEAKLLRKGDELLAAIAADDRNGYVLTAKRKNKLVQVRDARLD